MENEQELRVSVPLNIRYLHLNSAACELQEPDCLENCVVAKALSGEALKLLLRNCSGTQTKQQGCEEIVKCDSPQRLDIQGDM
jgi:hypothetical protein